MTKAPPPNLGDAPRTSLPPITVAPAAQASPLLTPAQQATASLELARRLGQPQPVIVVADEATAYEVQATVARICGWFGDTFPRHWKSGAAAVDGDYTHAPLPPARVFTSGADLSALPFNQRRVEAEVALRLARDVSAATAASLASGDSAALERFIDGVSVAIEIVDSRWIDGADAPVLSRLADQQSHGALVLGPWGSYSDRDWLGQHGTIAIGQAAAHRFAGSLATGSPLAVLGPWLRHVTQNGETAPAGTIVTTGAWSGALAAQAGDAVTVEFEGLGVTSVQL